MRVAERHSGRLDVCVTNAGFYGRELPLDEQDEESFDSLMAVNVEGVFLGMKYGIPEMLRTGDGSVVNTASGTGLGGARTRSYRRCKRASARGGRSPSSSTCPIGSGGRLIQGQGVPELEFSDQPAGVRLVVATITSCTGGVSRSL